MSKNYFVHESSYVDEGVSIGSETKIWHFCHIHSGAKIGERCVMGQNVNIGNCVAIGNGVKIQNNVSVYEGVTLEDYVFCGPGATFTNDLTPRAEFPKKGKYVATLVKRGASIGANATVVCGNTIGKSALIGSGAVVTKDVPDYAIAVGNPARVIGHACQCGEKLMFIGEQAVCRCGKNYRKTHQEIEEA